MHNTDCETSLEITNDQTLIVNCISGFIVVSIYKFLKRRLVAAPGGLDILVICISSILTGILLENDLSFVFKK